MAKALTINYEPSADRMTINGIIYPAAFFRAVASKPAKTDFAIMNNGGGVVAFAERPSEKLPATQ
jgi:hypothetical protein